MLDFIGIGAQKAGTTWLYEMLRHHPQVLFPAGKEIHFWDMRREQGTQWYRDLFAGVAANSKQGEITPAYAMLPPDTIGEIRALNPAMRVIYIIRNPIERAWSSALMELATAGKSFAEVSDSWFIDHFHSQGSLRRGDYESCIRNWRAVFGAEQLLLLRYENVSADPRGLLRACCEHLGVEPVQWVAALPEETVARRVFAGTAAAIRPSLMPVLFDLYRPRILGLADYLETDLGPWLGVRDRASVK